MNFFKFFFSKRKPQKPRPLSGEVLLQSLPVGKRIIVIETKDQKTIVQDVFDFQFDMNREGKPPTNPIILQGSEPLEKGGTYLVEEISETKILTRVSMMIMSDVMFG